MLLGYPVLDNSGQAAFSASLTGTSGGSSDNQGIFRGSRGVVTQITREGQAAPDGTRLYQVRAVGIPAFVASEEMQAILGSFATVDRR